MQTGLHDYEPIVGQEVIDELRVVGEHLKGRRLQNINATAIGGGVWSFYILIMPQRCW